MIIYLALLITFSIEIYRCLYPNNFILFYEKLNQKICDYKEELKPTFAQLCYKLIYFYSYLQIKISKVKMILSNTFVPYINIICSSIHTVLIQHNIINSPQPVPQFTIEFYKEGERVESILVYEINKIESLCNKHQQDFIILSDYSAIETYTNKIHYTNFYLDTEYKLSKIKFFSLDLMYNNCTYHIDLKTEEYNHYIVNNILNSDFFLYYLNHNLNVAVDKETFEYNITLLDHNVNFIELTHLDEIVIKEDNYEIRKNPETNNNENINNNNNEIEKTINDDTNHAIEDIDSDKSDDFIKLEKPNII